MRHNIISKKLYEKQRVSLASTTGLYAWVRE